ncbi:MAG TPA: SigB/SigF/SigG family RNA polymerase sigma factor [Streptosporangiaceae bacterium]|jgi:RNA polymerase sigma-B factor
MRQEAELTAGTPAPDDGWPADEVLLAQIRSSPAPDDAGRQAACETLVRRYDVVVRSCARRYRESPELSEDLVQVGYVGLMKAINNYDPAVGDSLGAYARPCITGEIKRYFRDKRWQVKLQRPAQELRLRLRTASAELTQQHGRSPAAAELAEHLGVSEREVIQAQAAELALMTCSLDAPMDAGRSGEAGELADLVGEDDPGLEHTLDMQAVWQHCAELPAREQRMLMMRFYGNMTQGQIGEQLGMSQMHVSRLLAHALGYLREQMDGRADFPA